MRVHDPSFPCSNTSFVSSSETRGGETLETDPSLLVHLQERRSAGIGRNRRHVPADVGVRARDQQIVADEGRAELANQIAHSMHTHTTFSLSLSLPSRGSICLAEDSHDHTMFRGE